MDELRLRVSWGHGARAGGDYFLKIIPANVEIAEARPAGMEPPEGERGGVWTGKAGGGDVDGLELLLRCRPAEIGTIQGLNNIWRDLIAGSDADTARRLKADAAYRPDDRRLTFQLDPDGRRGFTVTVDQLLSARTLWVPALDVYLDASVPPVGFADHQARLAAQRGQRVLDLAAAGAEASYEQFTALWEDMGSPRYRHSAQPAPGHIVCISWDSAVPKFGIDRGGGVWNDYGNPDRFRLWLGAAELGVLDRTWKGQRLVEGLPILITTLEQDGVRCEVEQFAYPLHGPPAERRGDIAMVLMQKVRLMELAGRGRPAPLALLHRRKLHAGAKLTVAQADGGFALACGEETLLWLGGLARLPALAEAVEPRAGKDGKPPKDELTHVRLELAIDLPAGQTAEFLIKLPSPAASAKDRPALARLDFASAREATRKFWLDWEARGAQFRVPERAVNELFRANLWHALRLPRRHGGSGPGVRIDLPYSNFAYDQNGIPWPVNQAAYVDYMIYGLRGYPAVAAEELAAMFAANQAPDGRIRGYANWLVYTPSLLYVTAQNYLLSQDREGFERLLPAALKAMDWCLGEIRRAQANPGPARGVVHGHLNDLTGTGYWAFNQAYLYGGLERFGRALQRHGHPRAAECLEAAATFRQSVTRSFAAGAVASPLVQLRDQTWSPYVPCEATRPGRRMDQWYPTDVDTGAMHLLRLKALPVDGPLADALLHDHEDNLYWRGWGMANEPVYNPQATAYLLRDEPKAAIRAFYSMTACAFSHTVFEPVEHRWTHGQYFGPPSTDGAWAELYRRMLIEERDDGALLLFAATPRKWLEDGKEVAIARAPTYYGPLNATLRSRVAAGRLMAEVKLAGPDLPAALLVRFRHPEAKAMRAASVDGKPWTAFDAAREWVRIDKPQAKGYSIEAEY